MDKIGRNALCPCGSGKKYKRCCGGNSVVGKSLDSPSDKFRYQTGSYGGPGGYFPSILCYQWTGPDSWSEHFCLVKPRIQHEEEGRASAAAQHDLDRALRFCSGNPRKFALYLKNEGYLSVSDFLVVKDSATAAPEGSVPSIRQPLGSSGISEPVLFISTETGKDLIVSFAVESIAPEYVLDLTLMRTPEYEFVFDDSERGVHVSNETDDHDDEFLLEIDILDATAEVRTTRHQYTLDLAKVEHNEIQDMKKVLQEMNFDQRFTLKIG